MVNDVGLVELPLQRSVPYIVSVLDDSRRSLAAAVRTATDFSMGNVVTWLPPGGQIPAGFVRGGLFPEPEKAEWRYGSEGVAKPVPTTVDAIATEIETFISEHSHRLCLLANENIDPGDQVAALYQDTIAYKNELYHLILKGTSRCRIANTIKLAKSVPVFMGVLSSTTLAPEIGDGTISEFSFREVATRTEGVIVGAFDGEGFLLWRKKPGT